MRDPVIPAIPAPHACVVGLSIRASPRPPFVERDFFLRQI